MSRVSGRHVPYEAVSHVSYIHESCPVNEAMSHILTYQRVIHIRHMTHGYMGHEAMSHTLTYQRVTFCE